MTIIRKDPATPKYQVELVSDGLRSVVCSIQESTICEEHGLTAFELAECFRDALVDLLKSKKPCESKKSI
jgi:hypothetical protein